MLIPYFYKFVLYSGKAKNLEGEIFFENKIQAFPLINILHEFF